MFMIGLIAIGLGAGIALFSPILAIFGAAFFVLQSIVYAVSYALFAIGFTIYKGFKWVFK